MFVSEIYSIEDCLSLNWQGFINSSYTTASVNNNTLSFSNSGAYKGAYIFNNKVGEPYVVELEYIETSGLFTFGLGFLNDNYTDERTDTSSNVKLKSYYGKANYDYWGTLTPVGSHAQPVTGDKFALKVYDTYVETYLNGELFATTSISISDILSTLRFAIIGTDTPYKQSWRNIKIKKL